MLRSYLLCVSLILLIVGASSSAWGASLKNTIKSDSIKTLPLKWKTYVGKTTYRTTIQYAYGHVFVPSNGKYWHKSRDTQDGVYILNPRNGKIMQHLAPPGLGEHDVNGVAISNSKIVFGDDSGVLTAFDWDFKPVWTYKIDSDFEGAPALMHVNEDAILDVVTGTESGMFVALNGVDGTILWSFQPAINPKYKWASERSFMASPSLIDINKDGYKDIFIGSRNGHFYALNGKTGKVIWNHKSHVPSGFLGSSFATSSHLFVVESYGILHKFSTKGRLLQRFSLDAKNSPQVVSMPMVNANHTMLVGTTFSKTESGLWTLRQHQTESFDQIGKISSSAMLANVDKLPGNEFVVVSESGWLYIINAEGKKVAVFKLPSGAEASPLIADIDNDKLLELVIALNNGYVYCYDLNSSGPVSWGRFRANPYNTGLHSDVLPEDGLHASFKSMPPSYPSSFANNGFSYNTWLSTKVAPYLISKNGIGPAQLGLTLAQFKLKLTRPIQTETLLLGNGLKAVAIIQDTITQYYLVFPQNMPITPFSKIVMVLTNNPNYMTVDGIHSGMSVFDASSVLGVPTFSYNRNYPLEEKLRLSRQPRWISFTSYSKVKAGKYRGNDRVNYTKNYEPGSKIQFIVVR